MILNKAFRDIRTGLLGYTMRHWDVPGYFRYYRPRAGDIIVDAGSYRGYLIDYVRQRFADPIKILSIEPEAGNFRFLEARYGADKNVKIINKALWKECAELPLYVYHPTGTIGSSVVIKYDSAPAAYASAGRLDSIAKENGLSGIDFIKMDIEGAEPEAIEGSEEVLKDHRPHLAIAAYHKRRDRDITGDLVRYLDKFNYHIKVEYIGFCKTIFAIPADRIG